MLELFDWPRRKEPVEEQEPVDERRESVADVLFIIDEIRDGKREAYFWPMLDEDMGVIIFEGNADRVERKIRQAFGYYYPELLETNPETGEFSYY